MDPAKLKKERQKFESAMSGKWKPPAGGGWYYAEDVEAALKSVIKPYEEACQIALDTLNYLGSVLNLPDEKNEITPAFDKLREVLGVK